MPEPGHDGGDQLLMRLVHSVECTTFGGRESLAASFAAVAPLFLAMDHDVALTRSAVGPAVSVVAESFLRVHADSLLLT
jgi:hypothetical protein